MKYVAISLANPGLEARPPDIDRIDVTEERITTCSPRVPADQRGSSAGRILFPSFNKVALIAVAAALIGIIIFLLAGNRDGTKPPKGVRNLAKIIVEFIEDQIVMPTMGRAGLRWTPFLISLFVFIYLCNAPGDPDHLHAGHGTHRHPAVPQPAGVGDLHRRRPEAPGARLLRPPHLAAGSPALKPLVGVIEFVSTILIRPFSLTVRLMANMMAGHILLVTFCLLTEALVQAETKRLFLIPMGILPFGMLLFLTAFEILVAFLQAYIFTILTGVFIGSSMEGHGDDHALDLGESGHAEPDCTPPPRPPTEPPTRLPTKPAQERPPNGSTEPPRPAGRRPGGRQEHQRRHRRRLRLRPRGHRPRHRHRLPRRQVRRGHGPPAGAAGMVRTTMFLGIAFTEALALIGFVVCPPEVRLIARSHPREELTCDSRRGRHRRIGLRGLRLRRGRRGGRARENEPARPTSTRSPRAEEMLWGFGSFVVFAVLLRYYLYPRLRKGMDAQYSLIRSGHEQAEQITDAARRLPLRDAAGGDPGPRRSSASRLPDDARRRAERLTEVQRRIAERRAAAPPRSSRPDGRPGRCRSCCPIRRRQGWRAGGASRT